LDNPSVSPFLNPERHSVHCLVDIKQCEKSGYEIVSLDKIKDGKHGRAFRLDSSSNDKMLKYARANGVKGVCKSCTATTNANNTYTNGFRAFLVAKVTTEASGSRPAIISITDILPSNRNGLVSVCPSGINDKPAPTFLFETNFHHFVYAHASMMIIGWGTLLPLGVIIAKLGRHLEPNGLWFKLHRPLQIIGLCFAFTGWIIALTQFNALEYGVGDRMIHAYIGMIVMSMGLLQPINAFFRPHIDPEHDKSTLRFAWEILHKSFGYISILLAVVVISIGTMIVPRPEDPKKFQMGYGIGSGLILTSTVIYLVYSKSQVKYKNLRKLSKSNNEEDVEL